MKDNFIHVKNMWKEQLCKLKVGDFCYGFPGPKTFRDLRETGPWAYNRDYAVSCVKGDFRARSYVLRALSSLSETRDCSWSTLSLVRPTQWLP